MRMNRRQKLLVHLLDMKGGAASNVCCQKLLFCFSQAQIQDGEDPLFEFLPWVKGAYSFTAHFEKDNLVEAGILADKANEKVWSLADARGVPSLDWADENRLQRVMAEYGDFSDDELIRRLYIKYPHYAVRSQIADELLKDFPDAMDEIRQARDSGKQACDRSANLFTIGYEGLSIEEFFERLKVNEIEMLIDVRKVPFSHKIGFSKAKLEKVSEGAKIQYRHMPQLGIPSELRRNLNTQADYDALFEEYKASILPLQGETLDKIARAVSKGRRIALMCFEADPMQCHRRIVADRLSQILGCPYSNLTNRALPTCQKQTSLAF